MRVAHFTNSALPIRNGVASSINRACRALDSIGWDNLVFANPIGRNMVDATTQIDEATWGNDYAEVHRPTSKKGSYLNYDFSELLRSFEPTVIHSHYPFSIGCYAMRCADDLKVPCVFTFHTDYQIYSQYHLPDNLLYEKIGAKLAVMMVRSYCNLSDVVVAPSKSFADEAGKRYGVEFNEILPTPVPVCKVTELSKIDCRNQLSLDSSKKYIGYVGRLGAEKNMRLTVDSFKNVLNIDELYQCIFVGSGPLEEMIRNVLWREINQKRVHFLKFENFESLSKLYRSLDLLVCLSQTETQGLVVNEAIACGCPVLTLDAVGVIDSMSHGAGKVLKIEQANPRNISIEIAEMSTFKVADIDLSSTFYNESKFSSSLESIYETAVSKGRSTASYLSRTRQSMYTMIESFGKNI